MEKWYNYAHIPRLCLNILCQRNGIFSHCVAYNKKMLMMYIEC